MATHANNGRILPALREFAGGRIGENSIVRSIALLNERVPSPIAEVSRDEIRVTAAGAALYRRYSGPVQGIRSALDNIGAMFSQPLP